MNAKVLNLGGDQAGEIQLDDSIFAAKVNVPLMHQIVLAQLAAARAVCDVPLVASGGAGAMSHFADVFREADVDAALAASVFHSGAIAIPALKRSLRAAGIEVRDESTQAQADVA